VGAELFRPVLSSKIGLTPTEFFDTRMHGTDIPDYSGQAARKCSCARWKFQYDVIQHDRRRCDSRWMWQNSEIPSCMDLICLHFELCLRCRLERMTYHASHSLSMSFLRSTGRMRNSRRPRSHCYRHAGVNQPDGAASADEACLCLHARDTFEISGS